MKWEVSTTSTLQSIVVVLRKSSCTVTSIVSWTSLFFIRYHFAWKNEWQTNGGYLTIGIWQTLFKHKQREHIVSRRTTDNICYQWYNFIFQAKIKILVICIYHCDHGSFSIIKCFSYEVDGEINKCDILMSYKTYFDIWYFCLTQWTIIFRMTNTRCYKFMCG